MTGLHLIVGHLNFSKNLLKCQSVAMSKFSLKFTLALFQGLMRVKRVLTFLFFAPGRYLEGFGRVLARFFIFPVYKIILSFKHWLKKIIESVLGRRQILFVLLLFVALILASGETKVLADNKYLGGRYSLLFTFLGPSLDADAEIFEEVISLNIPSAGAPAWDQGSLPAIAPGSESPDLGPIETIGLISNDTALLAPTIIPGAELGSGRFKIIKYVVQPSDTIGTVAQKFQISVETILIENKLTLKSVLRPGDSLNILPINGVSHKIKKGDSIKKIAALYKAEAQKIIDFNHLIEEELPIGEVLIVPEGKRIVTPLAPATQIAGNRPPALKVSSLGMLWPTVGRRITQYFSWRHTGIDIALPTGNPIYAALDGVVETSGWNRGGYGYQVVLRHSNGLKTRYAHSSKLYVSVGQEVSKGDVIALIGSTGRSTGPHVHFEVIVDGVRVNPFLYVK
ncbi:MAG: M23 family metallopeptidase [Candidatus Magasanikbacteria bacterium]|nr:M23 family metallopeptidase [Candidatus Magasanikbacteria bacterium]